MANFRLYDAGKGKRQKGDKGDCQVRALHTAPGLSYEAAWDTLYTLQGKYRTAGFNLIFYLDKDDLGVQRHLSFPAKRGQPRMTGTKFVKLYPKEHFILQLAHHVVAIKNGTVYDMWDSTGRCVYKAWEIVSPESGTKE